MTVRILLVEDEPEMASVLRTALHKRGVLVDHAATLADGGRHVEATPYDALVLDRRLPDGDGLSLVSDLRAAGNHIPVLMLTARDALDDRVQGLDAGADDYLGKPFAVEELLARIRALLRRPAAALPDVLRIAALSFDFTHCEASVDAQRMELPRRELLALETLVRRAGRTVLRSSLERAVFGLDAEIQSNALDTHVSRLRKKLADTGAGVEIASIRGVGYLLRSQS
ncbi:MULTISPECIES: response regulator transcription factor [Variovorax]|jgi:two-component system, OmpR family, response regulator|uniref:response regulator transcription factor n=1 Tax=Variovorax TaxID=34072 RepID=UPI001F1BD3B5|nr:MULTISPECIES: response regulator transcription factor [Variovorax]UKI07049.1 response regulator transcription factor [Variovorax paradoxus]